MGTTLQSLVTPSLSDPPSGPAQILAFGNAVEKQIIQIYATTVARDAAVTAPVAGMMAYLSTPKALTLYDGTAWRYLSPGQARVILTDAAQSITNVTPTDVTWGTEVSDPDGWTSGGIATLTVPTGQGGPYHVCFSGLWAGPAGTLNGSACLLNGVATYSQQDGGLWNVAGFTFLRTLVAGDTLKFQVYQNSGGALNIVSRLEITPA